MGREMGHLPGGSTVRDLGRACGEGRGVVRGCVHSVCNSGGRGRAAFEQRQLAWLTYTEAVWIAQRSHAVAILMRGLMTGRLRSRRRGFKVSSMRGRRGSQLSLVRVGLLSAALRR